MNDTMIEAISVRYPASNPCACSAPAGVGYEAPGPRAGSAVLWMQHPAVATAITW
jgi:hypothetical protein